MASDLTRTRATVQDLRDRYERRERTVVDLRTVLETLQARVLRDVRGAERERTNAELTAHLDRLLRRHFDGDRPVGYLGDGLEAVDIERFARDYFEREVVEAMAGQGPSGTELDGATGEGSEHVPEVTFEKLTTDPFPGALVSFLAAARREEGDERGAGEAEREAAETLQTAYEDLLDDAKPDQLLRAVSTVGGLVGIARLATVGGESDPIEGVRTALDQARADHVDSLAAADERLVDDGSDATDPFVDLDWSDPIALLPIRLETRFHEGDLKVRVYPEPLHVDAHEDQLTEAEREWGVRFWTRLWIAGLPDPATVLTVDGDTFPLSAFRHEAGELVVPDELIDDVTGEYRVLDALPGRGASETALELLRAFEAGEFSSEPARRYEEVRERAWARGVERFDEDRAAYLVEALAPTVEDEGVPVTDLLRAGFDGDEPPLSKAVPLAFPDVDLRPASWTRTPRASLLPDRFVVHAYYDARGNDEGDDTWTDVTPAGSDLSVYERRVGDSWVRRVSGPVVREPLAIGPSPESVAAGDADATAEMGWMTDFEEAKEAGVGISIPLPEPPTSPDYDPDRGFSRVVVTGAKTTMDAARSRTALAELLAATDHTEGLELLDPGTPTNNADDPSPRSSGRDPSATVDAATGPSLVSDGTDGQLLAEALGIPASTLAQVPGAGDTRDRDAAAMNRALWPGTIGYFARNLLVPDDSSGNRRGTGRKPNDADGEGREAHLETNAAGIVEVTQTPDAEVTGTATLRPGSVVTIRLRSARGVEPPWHRQQRTKVAEGGTFAAEFDFEDEPVGTAFTASVRASPPFEGTEYEGVVVGSKTRDTDGRTAIDGPLLLGTGPTGEGVEGPPMALWWLETCRDHFVDHVRGGGPFKTLRAGDQPYGVLPVSPLDVDPADHYPAGIDPGREFPADVRSRSAFLRPWEQLSGDFEPAEVPRVPGSTFVPEVVDTIRSLREDWLAFAEGVPSVGTDPGLSTDDLLTMLAMEATAFSYRRQTWLLGDDNPLYGALGLDSDRPAVQKRIARDLADAELQEFEPRIADLLFFGASMTARSLPITDADVGAFIGSVLDMFQSWVPVWALRVLGTDPDDASFGLSHSSSIELPRELFLGLVDPSPGEGEYDPSASLLRHVLRYAALQAAVASRVRIGAIYGWNTGEYLTFPAEQTTYGAEDSTIFELFDDPLPTGVPIGSPDDLADHPGLAAGDDFQDVLQTSGAAREQGGPPVDPALTEFLEAMDHLTTVDPGRLERLTRETMDLASHRLDAWSTSLATRRLTERRASSAGVQVGAYGFVENLVPDSGPEAEYLLAPSLDQATTAAVLRSAHSARARPDDPTTMEDESAPGRSLAVDCSAHQVKLARGVMRGIRRGLDLPELLGYRFERGLRAYSDTHGMDLEAYLDDFRAIAPTVEGKLPRGDTSPETRQSDVADGQKLYRLWKEGALTVRLRSALGTEGPASLPDDLVEAIGGESLANSGDAGVFPAIHRTMEAVNDVLLAEGVHHLVHGRPERAGAALEALSRGETPPEPTVLDTPRSETGVTHRLLLAFGDADTPTTRSAWNPPRRAVLEPSDVLDSDRPVLEGASTGDPLRHDGIDLEEILNPFDGVGFDGEATTMRSVHVRKTADPTLDAWVGDLLPDPDRVGCTGEFQWERERTFAVGEFETPASPGTVTVDGVGFEPDVVQFTAVPAGTDESTAVSRATGWSHGVFKRAVGEGVAVEHGTCAVVDSEGTVQRSTATNAAVELTFGATDDAGTPGRVRGTVVATTEDGFEVKFTTVRPPSDGPKRVAVQFRALQLADPTSVRVGTFRTPATEPTDALTLSVAGDGGVGVAEFSPDHVTLTACLGGESDPGTGLGFADGEAMHDGTEIVQQTTSVSLDPVAEDFHVSARDDAALALEIDDGRALELSVDGFGDDGELELTASAPGSASYPGETLVTYVAVESPTTETPGGESLHRPAIGTTAAPAGGEEQDVSIDTGFRPGLLEVRLVPGIAGRGAVPLPISESIDAPASLSFGASTGPVDQRSLASGVTGDGGSATRSPTAIAETPAVDGGELVAGTGVRVDAFDDEGFTLSFTNVPDGERALVQYRAWPRVPESQGFSAPLRWPDSGRSDGVSLSDLDLSPLDAIGVTQGVEAAGDSQLERRIGYFAFRHRPPTRPPVPNDATLDLAFQSPGRDHDVSIAEYVEVARRVNDLLGEARPATAVDLAHPSAADDEGYLPVTNSDDGTAGTLERRADDVERKLAELAILLEDRHRVLSGTPSVCDRVETLTRAIGDFRRTAPIPQFADAIAELAATHPDEHHQAVQDTVLAELRTVARHVRAGPDDTAGVDYVVTDETDRTVGGVAAVDGPTDLRVTVHSMSDATRFRPKTAHVTTDVDGAFGATFDFDGVPVGTEFTVVATPVYRDDGDGDSEDSITVFLDRLGPADRAAVLGHLAAEGVYDSVESLADENRFTELVADAADDLADGERPLAVLRELRAALRAEFAEEADWFSDVDADWRDRLDPLVEKDRKRFDELVAALDGDVLLDRTFDRPRPGDWTFVDEPPRTIRTSEWTFHPDEGELRQTSNIYGFAGPAFEAPGTLAVVGDRAWTDYRLTTEMTSEDDDAIGVVFRYRDSANFYRFSMDAEREYRRLVRKVDGEPELLWEDDAGFDPGRMYRLTVDCNGDTFRGSLDGEELFEVRDDGLERGAVGLYCRANTGARFHDLTVVGDEGSWTRSEGRPVTVANSRVVAADETGGWRNLPSVVENQQYLPVLLWLDRVLPAVDPRTGGAAAALATTVADTPWDTVETEHELTRRVLQLLGSGSAGVQQPLDDDDLEAIGDLLGLRPLDLVGLVDAAREVVGPTTWTGLTELVSLTGDVARPDTQRPWRSSVPSLETLVEKDPEGEVRARLERLREFPRTDAPTLYAAYSPPVRELLADGRLEEGFVTSVETLLANPAAVIETGAAVGADADVNVDVVDLVTGLHDLLHHVESFDDADRVRELRDVAAAFDAILDGAEAGILDRLDDLGVDTGALARGFENHGDTLEIAVRDYLDGVTTAAQVEPFLADYAMALARTNDAAGRELDDRFLPVADAADLPRTFRSGVLESTRHVLLRASYFGVYGSVPAAAAGGRAIDEATLAAQVEAVYEEVTVRLATAARYRPAGIPTVDGGVERIRALLGDEFVVLPPFAPTNPDELHATLTDDTLLGDRYEPDTWLQRVGRVRDLPRNFQRVRTYADSLGLAGGGSDGLRRSLTVGQLPHVPGRDWLGRDGVTPAGGELSLGVDFANEASGEGPIAADPGGTGPALAGLLIDEWVERVPDVKETVGLGLRYDDPSTRAPQSLLLAVPPTWQAGDGGDDEAPGSIEDVGPMLWTDALVRRTVEETVELVEMRSVDLDAFDRFGHLLPMLCFAYNRESLWDRSDVLPDAPSVDFTQFGWTGWFQ